MEQNPNGYFIKFADVLWLNAAGRVENPAPPQPISAEDLHPAGFTRAKHLTEDRTYAEHTARDYLNKLQELQVLETQSIGGNHYYVSRELYSILED